MRHLIALVILGSSAAAAFVLVIAIAAARSHHAQSSAVVTPGSLTTPAQAGEVSPGGRPRMRTLRDLYGIAPLRELDSATTALVLVDFQREFVDGALPLPDVHRAVDRARELRRWARDAGILVVHVHNLVTRPHSPAFVPGTRGTAFIDEIEPAPTEIVIAKASGGGFTNTTLDAELRDRGVDTVIVAGLMTHLAVHMTASDGAVRGFRVVVAADAAAARDLPRPGARAGDAIDHRTVHEVALASLADRFADVMSTEQILAVPVR